VNRLILLFALIILGLTIPVQAQTAADPARAVGATTPLYLQMRTDEASLSAYQALFHAFARSGNQPLPPQMNVIQDALNPALDVRFATIDVQTDVLPWLGESIGMAVFGSLETNPQAQQPTDYALALPVKDAAAAQAFVGRVAGEPVAQIGGAAVYAVELSYLAATPEMIWIGSPDGVTRTLNELAGGSLADDDAYNRVRSQLPTDALISGFVSGEWAGAQTAPLQTSLSPGFPSPASLLEAALRLHPAESDMEAALLQQPSFTGAGFTVEYVDEQLNVTAAALLDATYAAPSLTSQTAGAALLDLVPANSVLVFDSYDLSLLAVPYAGVFVTAPVVSTRFDTIVSALQDPAAPTPTPVPPPTADELVSQAQPFLQQIEAMLGMSLADLYSLINGEYAFAIFPVGESAQPGFALWLQTSDAERLLGLRNPIQMILGLSSGGAGVQTETTVIGEVEVHYIGLPGAAERLALGTLPGGVAFVATENSLNAVLAAANDGISIEQMSGFPGDDYQRLGTGQDAVLYADLSAYTVLTAGTNTVTMMPPVGRVIALADAANDGLFTMRAVLTLAQR
jgi:hypothetical protein